MPTIEEITKILANMSQENYGAAVKYIYFLASNQHSNDLGIEGQKKFLEETVGKVEVDEDAINNLRMRSMI